MNQIRMGKADEILSTINIFLSTTTDRITPNIILLVTMANGFGFGFLTTGYLGKDSMGVFTFLFWFFVWQFVLTCFLTSRHVNLTTEYLTKFFLAAVIGYYVQWQVFGIYVAKHEPEMVKFIEPAFDGGSGNFIFILFLIMGVSHCFSGNELKNETKIDMTVG